MVLEMRRFLNGLTPVLVLNQKSLLIGLIVVFLIGNIGCPPPRRTDQQVPTNKPADPNDVNENVSETTVKLLLNSHYCDLSF